MKNSKRTNRRNHLVSAVLTFLILFSATGCQNTVSVHPTDILSNALDAELSVDTGAIVYRVTVHLGAVSEEGKRDAEVIFLAPESLAGMTVRENAEGRTVSRGDKTVKTEHADGLLLAVSLLSPDETVRIDALTENGHAYMVSVLSDGRTIYSDPDTGVIRRIESDGASAEVEWIEGK